MRYLLQGALKAASVIGICRFKSAASPVLSNASCCGSCPRRCS